MQDNFNIHSWRLNRALNELNEKKLCTECGSGYMEEGQCMECGYMEEGFPDLSGDGKITQKDILIGRGVIKKEGLSEEEIKQKCTRIAKRKHDKFPSTKATVDIMACVAGKIWADEIEKLKEGMDHEVSMAQASLKSIMSSASKIMTMLGNEERNIPGWIQDHITNAENYIDQAAQGFHELDNETEYEED